MKYLSIVFICLISFLCTHAQKDTVQASVKYIQELTKHSKMPNTGQISIKESDKINNIVHKYARISKSDGYIYGWRIQIYYSSDKDAREKCGDVKTDFLKMHPDIKAYTIYQPPVFRIRVGDFRNKHEAFQLYKELLPHFPVSYLVQDKINLPPID